MKLLKELKEKDNFSPTEQIVIEYLLNHYQEVMNLSARQLAEKTYTSSAAVVRLCQKLGLKGYSEFKIKFTSEVMRTSTQNGMQKNAISNRDSVMSIVNKVACIQVEAIEETKNELNPNQLMRTVQMLEQANHVDFYAMDSNLQIAKNACYCFLHAGKLATVNTAINAQYVQAMATPKDHLAIIISRTGENRKLIEIAEILKKRKVQIIVLTSVQSSTLTDLSNESFYISTEKDFAELGTLVFLTGANYIVDVLFSLLFAKHYDTTLSRNEVFEQIFRV